MIVRLVKALLLFAIAGPLLGLAGFLVGSLVLDPSEVADVDLPLVLPLAALSYLVGVVPALLTGLAAWTFRNKLGRYSGALFCGVVGACVSAWWVLPENPLPWLSITLLGIVPGALAGLACGLAYFWSRGNQSRRPPLHRRSIRPTLGDADSTS